MDAAWDGLLYLGSLIYRKEGNSIGLERAIFDGGMYVALSGNGAALIPKIHVTDHRGSVRAIVDSSSGAPLEITSTTEQDNMTTPSEDGSRSTRSQRNTTASRRTHSATTIR